MSCKYCDNHKRGIWGEYLMNTYINNKFIKIDIMKDGVLNVNLNGIGATCKISYCPMCGRKIRPIEILPCPFCGREAEIGDGGYSGHHYLIRCTSGRVDTGVGCPASGGIVRRTIEEAIETWNNRR